MTGGGEKMNIKKLLISTSAGILMLGVVAFPAFAAPVGVNIHKEAKQNSCDVKGAPLVNVDYKVINDYDSNTAGTAWANDTIHRTLKIWKLVDGSYCGQVADDADFVTFASTSPNGTGTVGAGIKGEFNGGYTALLPSDSAFAPTISTHGNLGVKDYACTGAYTCPGAFDWASAYFSNKTDNDLNLSWWGWKYHTAHNGSMVQSSIDGYIGDITGDKK